MRHCRRIQGWWAVLLVGAIAPWLSSSQTIAQAPQLAQAQPSLVGQCRAVNRKTPVFDQADVLSSALRLLPADAEVTLASAAANGFIRISAPLQGFVQTAVLKSCGGPPPPTNRTVCRLLQNASRVNIRREPRISSGSPTANVIAVAYRGDRLAIFVDQNFGIVHEVADGYVWVKADLSPPPFNRPGVSGWLFNSYVGQPGSNLVYCP